MKNHLNCSLPAMVLMVLLTAAAVSAADRFTDNGNGTITDTLTHLVWLKNANCNETVGGIAKPNGYQNWYDALS